MGVLGANFSSFQRFSTFFSMGGKRRGGGRGGGKGEERGRGRGGGKKEA